jgi:hypothetical protein
LTFLETTEILGKIVVDIPENFQNFGENKFDNEGKFWAKKRPPKRSI